METPLAPTADCAVRCVIRLKSKNKSQLKVYRSVTSEDVISRCLVGDNHLLNKEQHCMMKKQGGRPSTSRDKHVLRVVDL